MKEFLWKLGAWVVSREPVANWLIKRAEKNPYFNLEGYMNRGWVFNPYSPAGDEKDRHDAKFSWLPSIRVHHILRADNDRHKHDHPWDARTIILKGWYRESKLEDLSYIGPVLSEEIYYRKRGDTSPLRYGEYHSIDAVSDGGVVTLFFTWKYMGTWGFFVDGVKIPWREYLREEV